MQLLRKGKWLNKKLVEENKILQYTKLGMYSVQGIISPHLQQFLSSIFIVYEALEDFHV